MLRTVWIVALAACGSAHVIQRTQAGGTIELSGDRGRSMDDAHEKMTSHCGVNSYTIVNEGFEPKGAPGDDTTAPTTPPQTGMVWRVHYQCNGLVATPPPSTTPPAASSPSSPDH